MTGYKPMISLAPSDRINAIEHPPVGGRVADRPWSHALMDAYYGIADFPAYDAWESIYWVVQNMVTE